MRAVNMMFNVFWNSAHFLLLLEARSREKSLNFLNFEMNNEQRSNQY